MTITSTDTRIAYAGNGTSTAFALPWQFFGPNELRVWAVDANEVETLLERGVHYVVTGGAGSTGTAATGTVVATVAPPTGTTWVIRRSTTPTQQVALPATGPLPAPTLERALDRLTAIAQENQATLLRTVRVPPGEATDVPLLPSRSARAGRALAFDAFGDPTATLPAPGAVPIGTAMEPVLAAATLRNARSLMGGLRHVDVVRDFGADNTNGSDASAAIQAAINSLTAGIVYFPPGVYGLAGGLTLKPSVMLEGDDPYIATLVARANSIDLLGYTAAATAGPFAVRRLGFSSGGFSNIRHIALNGVDLAKRISLVSLEDIYCGPGAVGVDLRWTANARLENVRTNTTVLGIYLDNAADTEVLGGWSQNGSNHGIMIVGGPGAYDEGVRINGYATNGQVIGIGVYGQDWGQITGCSLTTATGGPLIFNDAKNWKVTGGQLATGTGSPATPGASADANCEGIQIDNCLIALNTFGVNLLGEQHLVTDCRFTGNSDVDVNLQAVRCVVTGNICHSTGAAASVLEQAGSDYNNVNGNSTNGTVTLVGANSVASSNLVY
jgi:hypothetical protein